MTESDVDPADGLGHLNYDIWVSRVNEAAPSR
jgi:hypothetical protein